MAVVIVVAVVAFLAVTAVAVAVCHLGAVVIVTMRVIWFDCDGCCDCYGYC